MGVIFTVLLVEPGGIEVDEHGFLFPKHNIFRFNIPVNGSHRMKDPQGEAELAEDAPGFLGGKEGVLQHYPHVVPLDVFF